MSQTLRTRLRENKKSLMIVGACFYLVAAGLFGFWAHHKVSQWFQLRADRIAASSKVYITPEGKKYHAWHHYRERSNPISFYEAKELGFEHLQDMLSKPSL